MMMRTGALVLLAILLAAALPCVSPAAAQDVRTDPPQKSVPRVTVPQSVGPAGGTVAVPIQFAGDESRATARLHLTVRFPAAKLTFSRVEVGGLGASAGAEATARMRRIGNDTVLDVVIATPDTAGAKLPLPDGPIAQLMFTIGKDLKPETVISFALAATVVGTDPGAKPVAIPLPASEIIVSNPSVISCFFYMH